MAEFCLRLPSNRDVKWTRLLRNRTRVSIQIGRAVVGSFGLILGRPIVVTESNFAGRVRPFSGSRYGRSPGRTFNRGAVIQ